MVAEQIAHTATPPALAQLRWEFVTLLGKVEDTETLSRMLRLCLAALQEDANDDLPPHIIAALQAAALDDDETDTVSNEEAFKQFRAWVK